MTGPLVEAQVATGPVKLQTGVPVGAGAPATPVIVTV